METNTNFKVSKHTNILVIIKHKNGKYYICSGGYAVSNKKFDTIEQAEAYIAKKPYELLVNLCYILLKVKPDEEAKTATKESSENA